MTTPRKTCLTIALLFWLGVAAVDAAPMGSAFTYQGQLKEGGLPVTDSADFQFTLWDAAIGGAQVSLMAPVSGVSVQNGLFTVQVDFGTAAFAGDARWIEIAVRSPAGSGSLVTLAPRQELTATPYAFYAPLATDCENADKLDGQHGSFYQNASNLNAGTVAEARLPQNAIDSSEIEDNTLTSADILNGTIVSTDIADGTITSADIADGTVASADVADNSLTASDLAASSVGTSEIADGAIVNADVSSTAAIAPSKISGTAWTYSADGYPPRCDYSVSSGFLTTSGSYTTVTSVSIEVPSGGGYLYAEASAASGYWDGTYEGMIALGFNSTSENFYTERWFTIDTSNQYLPVSTSRTMPVNSGTNTVYFLAKRYSGSGQTWLPRYALSVIYIDNLGKAERSEWPPQDPEPQYRPEDNVGF